MVKILFISDTVMPQLENTANLRRHYNDLDMIISCGDMPRSYLEFITSITGAPLYYVRGNHDERYLEEPPGGVDLHQQFVEYKGLTLFGLEGSIRYNRGKIQYTQFEMWRMVWGHLPKLKYRQLRKGHGVDIFVTHSPARDIHDGEDFPHRGFDAFLPLMRWCRPRYMVHGHVHTWDRRKTTKTDYHDTCIMNINPFTVMEITPVEAGKPSNH